MKIKISIWLLVTFFLMTVSQAGAQNAQLAKIGWLGALPAASDTGSQIFARELNKVGYVEGKNMAFEYRFAENKLDRLPALADELVRLKVNVIVAPSESQALAAKNATQTIPVVFYSVGDPIASGLVDSLARPGRNVTGYATMSPVLAGKRLELLKETIPKLSRVAVLWDPQVQGTAQEWKESQLPARELGLQLHSMEVSSAEKYESAFKEAAKARSGALVVIASPLAVSNQKRIVDLATKNRLPAIYHRGNWIARGGLMSYGADGDERFRRGAVFVDKILKGAKPADLPVEQPTKFEFVINLKTANALNLTIPQSVLFRADKVIK